MVDSTCTPNPAFSYTRYPCDYDDPRPSVDTKGLPLTVDQRTPVRAEVVNRQRESILALESELGLNPSGTYTSVRDRLDMLEELLSGVAGTAGVTSVFGRRGAVLAQSGDYNTDLITNRSTLTGITLTQALDNITSDNIINQSDMPGSTVTDALNALMFNYVQETIPVTSIGQTSFTLSQTPAATTSVEMFTTGISQTYETDYTVSGSTVTYIGSVSLSPGDTVTFKYFTGGSVPIAGTAYGLGVVLSNSNTKTIWWIGANCRYGIWSWCCAI